MPNYLFLIEISFSFIFLLYDIFMLHAINLMSITCILSYAIKNIGKRVVYSWHYMYWMNTSKVFGSSFLWFISFDGVNFSSIIIFLFLFLCFIHIIIYFHLNINVHRQISNHTELEEFYNHIYLTKFFSYIF